MGLTNVWFTATVFCLISSQSTSGLLNTEQKLLRDILARYARVGVSARPGQNSSVPMEVGLSACLLRLDRLDTEYNTATFAASVKLTWHDDLLTWNRTERGFSTLSIDYDKIWTPDIVVVESVSMPEAIHPNTRVSAQSNGEVTWFQQNRYTVRLTPPSDSQDPDLHKFTCTFAALTSDKSHLIIVQDDYLNATFFAPHPIWVLYSYYEDDTNLQHFDPRFSAVAYSMEFRRRQEDKVDTEFGPTTQADPEREYVFVLSNTSYESEEMPEPELEPYQATEEKLIQFLLENYDNTNFHRPSLNSSEPISVDVLFSLKQIQSFDQQGHIMTLVGRVVLLWTDESLVWDPERFDGITRVVINRGNIWTPDVTLLDSVAPQEPIHESQLKVDSNGIVTWFQKARYHVGCLTDPSADQIVCSLKFSSMTMDSSQLQLGTGSRTRMDAVRYIANGEWESYRRNKVSVTEYDHFFDIGRKYAGVEYELNLRRRQPLKDENADDDNLASSFIPSFSCLVSSLILLLLF